MGGGGERLVVQALSGLVNAIPSQHELPHQVHQLVEHAHFDTDRTVARHGASGPRSVWIGRRLDGSGPRPELVEERRDLR
jgi:hypothetical protein